MQTNIINLNNNTNHTQELICERISGVGLTTISETVGIGHFLVDTNGTIIKNNETTFDKTITSGTSYTLIDEYNITTGNQSNDEKEHSIIVEGMIEYNNNHITEEELSTYATIDNNNCSTNPRDVSNSGSGSVSYDCILENVTNSTIYNIKIYGNGTNANYKGNFIAKSFFLSEQEIAGGTGVLKGAIFTGNTDTKLFNLSGGNLNHDLTNVFQKVGYSIITDIDTTVSFYVKIKNGKTFVTDTFSRGFTANNIGFLIGHDVIEDVPIDNDYQLELWANCGTVGATCEIIGGSSLGYITDITETILNSFNITALNKWNNTQIMSFNATDGAIYSTEDGLIIFFSQNDEENITISAENYINQTYINHNTTQNISSILYQSRTELRAREINTLNSINNWSIVTDEGTFYTGNGTIVIFPNIGVHNWNVENNQSYFNQTDVSFNINESNESLTIFGIYARNISFQNIFTSEILTPSCSQDGFLYETYSYLIHKSTNEIICDTFGYEQYTIQNNNFPDSATYNLVPVALMLNFTEQTSGVIQAGDVYIKSFNATQIEIPQANITEGYVKITFNPDENNKYQQIFSYYNDLNTSIRDNILVQAIDLQQSVKITGNTQALQNARVCTRYPLNDTYYTTYCDFTDNVGNTIVQVNDQNTYQICVQAEGYEPKCELHYIPATNQDTITIDLISTDAKEGTNYIKTSCNGVYTSNKLCTLQVVTYKPYYSICLNVTKTIGASETETQTCGFNSISETFLYTLFQTYDKYELDIYLNGVLEGTIIHTNGTLILNNEINYRTGNNTGYTIIERVEQHKPLYIMIHILLLVIAIISGYIFEKYYKGYGVYGSGIWFLFLGIGGFYVFYIPAAIIVVYFILERVMPMFQN